MLKRLVLVGVLLGSCTAQTQITDLMTPEQFRRCGLPKLTQAELQELNVWMGNTLIALSSSKQERPKAIVPQPGASADSEMSLFDASGTPTAYLATDDEMTIYLWSGKPVAYVDDENVYGFNGKHLGWFKDGILYDHNGDVAGATKDNFATPVKFEPFKAFKQFKPFKAFEQFAPFPPFLKTSWSRTQLSVLLSQGQK